MTQAFVESVLWSLVAWINHRLIRTASQLMAEVGKAAARGSNVLYNAEAWFC
jgi:hypothetical protein